MSKPAFPIDVAGLGLASLMFDSIQRDWSNMHDENTGERGFEAVLPRLPLQEVENRASDLWEDHPEQAARFKADPTATVDSDDDDDTASELFDAFWQSDAGDEWRDSYEPMMNYGWPVYLGYQPDLKAIASRIEEMGVACSLIEISGGDYEEETYEIAFTGGGMNLGDHLFAAYLACGQVPPVALLESMTGCLPSYILPRLPVAAVYEKAREALTRKVSWLTDQETSILQSAIRETTKG